MFNISPVIASLSFSNIPSSLAIAVAVKIWSPVIIIVFIPASLAFSIEAFASSLGGSIIPMRPNKDKSFSKTSLVNSFGNSV